jgi:glycerol transport system permease protein
LSLQLGEEIKGFSYGSAAARAMVNFLFVLTLVWVFVKLRQSNDSVGSKAT